MDLDTLEHTENGNTLTIWGRGEGAIELIATDADDNELSRFNLTVEDTALLVAFIRVRSRKM